MEGSSEVPAVSPQLHAIESMVPQLEFSNVNVDSAIQNIATAALHADDIATKQKALDILGNFAGKQFHQQEFSWTIPNSQDKARQRMLAIGLSEDNAIVQASAVNNLARGLQVSDFENADGRYHRMIVQNMTILACASSDPEVKKTAITNLNEYATREQKHLGYVGSSVVPQIQKLANDAIGAITASGKKPEEVKG
ncbi:MAG TPA: hypothetical protein PLS49_01120 [Candidatus Woesebacteria bacterium]|nr:hypothetical protein [Candidatus Woesebacteria bacterium]